MRVSRRIGMALLVALFAVMQACSRSNWSTATRDSSQHAPRPDEYSGPVVLAYRAKVWGVRGVFADHTWLATKAEGASEYTVYEVIGWRRYRNMPSLRIAKDVPDRHWFGAEPIPIIDLRGDDAAGLVERVDEAARRYPYANEYKAFPGPNSNTFTAWVAQEVPELGLELPLRAIGKGYPLVRAGETGQ